MSSLIPKIYDRLKYQLLHLNDLNRERIFVVGLSRTGTTSTHKALEMLGYKSFHMPPMFRVSTQGKLELDWQWWLNKYDAFSDIPVTRFFVELDHKFPQAKFIQTVRDKDAWLESCRKHFSVPASGSWQVLRQEMYGTDRFDKNAFLDAYDYHHSRIQNYFEGRSDFMTFNVGEGDGWEKLCSFLGKDIPNSDFPRANVKNYPSPKQ